MSHSWFEDMILVVILVEPGRIFSQSGITPMAVTIQQSESGYKLGGHFMLRRMLLPSVKKCMGSTQTQTSETRGELQDHPDTRGAIGEADKHRHDDERQ